MSRALRRIPRSVARGLDRVERRIGAHREGRSPWVWLVPLLTVIGTFVLAMKVSADGGLGLVAAVPMALVLCTFMGGMSVAYLTAAAADLRDAEADDGDGDGGGRGPERPPSSPSPQPAVRRRIEVISVRRVPDRDRSGSGADREREPEPAGGSRRRR